MANLELTSMNNRDTDGCRHYVACRIAEEMHDVQERHCWMVGCMVNSERPSEKCQNCTSFFHESCLKVSRTIGQALTCPRCPMHMYVY